MTNPGEGLLLQAAEEFTNRTKIEAEIVTVEPRIGQAQLDAMLLMPTRNLKFLVEVKKGLRRGQAGAVIKQLQYYRGLATQPVLLVADYLNPPIAEILKEAGIEYLDIAGNAYIAQDPLFIYIAGQKLKTVGEGAPTETGRAFKWAGLKIVFALLTEPELIGKTYRKIAGAAQVALGAVGPVLEDLEKQRYVVKLGKGGRQRRVLENREKLIDKWAEFYPHRLRQKLKLGEFKTDNEGWWKSINITEFGAVWGGELAAAEYTKYLKPADITVYIEKEKINALLARGRLRKVRAGEDYGPRITLFEKFWTHRQTNGRLDLADPVLVYADLLETADPRNLETARLLKDQFID